MPLPTSAEKPTPAGRDEQRPIRIAVLGSTGSIGVNTLAVIDHLTRSGQRRFEVVGLAAGRNAKRLDEQARQFRCPAVALAQTSTDARRLKTDGRAVFVGQDAAEQLIEACEPDYVVAAIVGVAGLPATLAAIRRGCTVALANKETLVAAGHLVMPLAAERGATILPIDSEHSAIFQCLPPAGDARQLRRVVLTASGGPFRDWPADRIATASPAQALQHPTWDMGPKITVDSATMMNKALEIIEAQHLFGLTPEQIDVVVHPQSVVHGFVEFSDHSVLAQLGPPDMRTPIQVALTWPNRQSGISDRLDWRKLSQLDFRPPDGERFPALKLAYRVMRAHPEAELPGEAGETPTHPVGSHGSTAGAVFNAANEAAVDAFLEHRIPFGRIVELVETALDICRPAPLLSLDDVMQADHAARQVVRQALDSPPADLDS